MAYVPTAKTATIGVVLAAALWGLYWVPVRQLEADGIDASLTVALLNLPPIFVTAALAWATWRDQLPHLKASTLIGFVGGAAMALYGIAMVHTEVIRATMFFYLMPVWGTLIGIYWLGEVARARRWLAIALGLAGMFGLFSADISSPFRLGDLLALLSGILWAVASALIKREGNIPVSAMLTSQFFFTSVFAILLGLMLGTLNPTELNVDRGALILATAIGLIALLPAALMIFWASQFLFPGRVGILLMAEVVVAIISASLLLPEEVLSPVEWLAVVLIIGAAIVEITPSQADPKQTTPSSPNG